MARRAMTIIELMVVLAVVGLLVSMVAVTADSAIYSARARNSRQVMVGVELAIDLFKTEDPLRLVYDRPELSTFGPLPPYQLANYQQDPYSVADSVEPSYDDWDISGNGLLSDRLFVDLGRQQRAKRDWVRLGDRKGGRQLNDQDGHDDIRALSAYLAAFMPGALVNLPAWALKPLNPDAPDMINVTGSLGSNSEPGQVDSTWTDVLGVHDAWGVPLDYVQYVRLDWTVGRIREVGDPRGPVATFAPGYYVKDRRAALRSRGVDFEEYEAWLDGGGWTGNAGDVARYNKPSAWIWSSELPRPWLPIARTNLDYVTGSLAAPTGGAPSGWLRAVAHEKGGADYGYLPDDDGQ
jgi:prepilin-type N-terminal cleavage/methylation domain-containing protein